MTDTKDLIVPIDASEKNAIKLFTGKEAEQAFNALFAAIEEKANEHVPDVSTTAGRDAIKSLAYKITRTKTTVDNMGAELVEGLRSKVKAVDARRKTWRDRLDELKEKVRKPLTDYEEARKKYEQERAQKIMRLREICNVPFDATLDTVKAQMIEVDSISEFDFEDEAELANEIVEEAMRTLARAVELIAEREKIAAENARIQAEQEEEAKRRRAEEQKRQAEQAAQAKELEELRAQKAAAEAAAAKARQEAEEANERAQRAALAEEERKKREAEEASAAAKAEADRKEAEAAVKKEEERRAAELKQRIDKFSLQSAADLQKLAKELNDEMPLNIDQLCVEIVIAIRAKRIRHLSFLV